MSICDIRLNEHKLAFSSVKPDVILCSLRCFVASHASQYRKQTQQISDLDIFWF